MSTEDIIQEASALEPEQRAMVIDSLLRTFHKFDPGSEKMWIEVAKDRLAEYRSGRAETVTFDELLANLRRRFTRE